MKENKSKKFIKNAALIGILGVPLATILSQASDTEAMMRLPSAIKNNIKPSVPPIKPFTPPKPPSKLPQNVIVTSGMKNSKVNINIPKGNVFQKSISFDSGVSKGGKPIGPISQKIAELNLRGEPLTRPTLDSRFSKVNTAINDLKTNGANIVKTSSGKVGKLNFNGDFKNKLSSIINQDKSLTPKPSTGKQNTTVGKLNLSQDSKNKLNGIFGNGANNNNNHVKTPSLQNNDSSIPSTPPLLTSKPGVPPAPPLPNSAPEIPPAPPLPTSKPNIPPAPPLPTSKPPQQQNNTLKPVNTNNNGGKTMFKPTNGPNFDGVLYELKSKFKPLK